MTPGALALLPVALVYRVRRASVRRRVRRGLGARPEADAIAVATGNAALMYARLLLGAWRGVEADAMELIDAGARRRDRRRRGIGGDGRLRAPPCSTTASVATRRPSTAPSAAATTATRATPARRCQSSSRRRRVPASRRSPPPRCPGWKSGPAPRARTGRSGSWRGHGR